METKLPWYVLPLYPALALVIGVQLAEAWQWRSSAYPRTWVAVLALLALGSTVGSFYYSPWMATPKWELQVILAAVGVTMTLAAMLAALGDKQFISILFWGSYVSLLLLMTSHEWLWELGESYTVKPVAAIIQNETPVGQKVYTSYPNSRPALDFYSDRQVIPAIGDPSRGLSAIDELQQKWQQDSHPYFLLDRPAQEQLNLTSVKLLGTAEGWTLMTK